jgi:rhombotail lipoprotein
MKCRGHLVLLIGICFASAIGFSSCATLDSLFTGSEPAKRYSTSVLSYLYPDNTDHVEHPSIPRLELPLKVGVAFVPGGTSNYSTGVLSEAEKMELMKKISQEFRQYDFVKAIELIPSDYLVYQGSFTNLDQIRTMYGIDVIALISYDQVQHTDQGLLSVTYWTLVGAYVFKGEKNDTSTMMDTAVYDIASRKMLFRAPGISAVKGKATLVNLSEQLREDSSKGFNLAAEKMTANLQLQLELFKEKVKESPEEVVVVHKPGYSGMGSMGLFYVTLVLGLAGFLACSQKTERS